jgi:hypothetical protein
MNVCYELSICDKKKFASLQKGGLNIVMETAIGHKKLQKNRYILLMLLLMFLLLSFVYLYLLLLVLLLYE